MLMLVLGLVLVLVLVRIEMMSRMIPLFLFFCLVETILCGRLLVIPSTMFTFRPRVPGILSSPVHIQVTNSSIFVIILFFLHIFLTIFVILLLHFVLFMCFHIFWQCLLFTGSSTTSGSSPQVKTASHEKISFENLLSRVFYAYEIYNFVLLSILNCVSSAVHWAKLSRPR